MEEINMSETIPEKNKALVLEAFDTLFNKRDYAAAENFWSPNYIQHSAHIEAGRDGVVQFDPERTEYAALPASAHRCRARLFIVHGRFSGHGRPWLGSPWILSESKTAA